MIWADTTQADEGNGQVTIFGDIERLLALLYPYRLPLAVLGVLAVIGLGIAARRRRWDRVARRHPRATIVILAAVLVVGAPVTWVLGSPLFIRTELVEATTVTSGTTTLIGTFTGADEFHTGSGTAQIVEAEPGRFVLRLEQFSVRNGPDLFVYLSSDPTGYANGAIELGALKASDGSFEYKIPAGTDIAHIRSAVIWCRAFSVQFSVAPLSVA